MIILTVEQQNRLGRAMRRVGSYDNLIKLERRRRYCKENNLPFDVEEEIKKLVV